MPSLILAATQRTGSTYCGSLLKSTGVAGDPTREPWNLGVEKSLVDRREMRSYGQYLETVKEMGTTPNGVFGACIHWSQMAIAHQRLRLIPGWNGLSDAELWEHAFPNPRFVRIWREDVARQAVSWAIALQTRQFEKTDRAERAPVYDFWIIDRLYWTILADNKAWDCWMQSHGITPLHVQYERLQADPRHEIGRILDFLEVEMPPRAIRSAIRRQSTDLNDKWLGLFLLDRQRSHADPSRYEEYRG